MIMMKALALHALIAQFPAAPPLPHPDLPAPDALSLPTPWWLYVAAALLVLALGSLVVWLLIRPKEALPTQERQPWSSAFTALNELRTRSQHLPPPETSHRVSQILRRYLLERYAVPAPARTTREIFSNTPERVPGVPVPRAQGFWRERFEPVAELCDGISFMPAPRTPEESAALIDQALARLQEEKP